MGLDDLWRVQLALTLVALALTSFVGGVVTLLSYAAWRWALSMLVTGRSLSTPRLLSALALAVAGLPPAYTLGFISSFPGTFAVAGLLVTLALALAALVHAAFRDESIRHLKADGQLADTLAGLDRWERPTWLREAGRLVLPSFTGATRARALKRAATVAFVWIVPLVVLQIVRS